MLEVSRHESRFQFALCYLKRLAHAGLLMLHQCGGGHAYLSDGRTLVFDSSGICNVEECLKENTHRSHLSSLKLAWDAMKSDHQFVSDFNAAAFVDLTVFLGTVRRFRRSEKNIVGQTQLQVFGTCFAGLLSTYLLLAYSTVPVKSSAQWQTLRHEQSLPEKKRVQKKTRETEHDSVAQLVAADESEQADQGASEENKKERQWVQVDLDEIWNLYSDSIEVKGLSLQQIVRSKARSQEGGCKESTVINWLGKIQAMYKQRASLGFKDETHLNLISDASRHSTRDTLVSAFYSPDRDIAAYGASQILRTAKTFPGEIDCEQVVEKMLAQKKADRLAAYRVCQGLSNQLKNITNGSLTLTSFLCEDQALCPLTSKVLHICSGNGITLHFKETNQASLVDLDALAELPCLVLGMDQGSQGMAAAGFLHTCLHAQFYYDPFHRLARDMKGAVSGAPANVKQRLQLALLSSTYLWSLSYKPFKQGSFFQDKVELLERFCQTESQDCSFSLFMCLRFAMF